MLLSVILALDGYGSMAFSPTGIVDNSFLTVSLYPFSIFFFVAFFYCPNLPADREKGSMIFRI